MQVTLYKNCPIPDDYSVVWNNTTKFRATSVTTFETAHDKLLNSLSSITIDISDIYLDDTGSFVLDIENVDNNIFYTDYNYMSYTIYTDSGNAHIDTITLQQNPIINYKYKNNETIVWGSNSSSGYVDRRANYLKRYAFIDKIEYSNSCIKITYKSDIYSTYSPFINYGYGRVVRFSDSCLYRIQQSDIITEIALEEDYFSNNPLLKYNLSGSTISASLSGNQNCYCMATIQYYKLDAQGEQTDRFLDSILIGRGTSSGQQGFTANSFVASVDEWNTYISELMVKQSTLATQLGLYYELQDIYFIPVNLNNVTTNYKISTWIDNLFNGTLLWLACLSNYIITEDDSNNQIYYYLMSLAKYFDNTNFTQIKPYRLNHTFELGSGSITNDFKRVGIGFYTHMIPIECNNPLTYLTYNIVMSFDCANINFYIEINNKIIEITNDLIVKLPIQVATADATQLQSISRAIQSKKNIASGAFGATQSLIGGIGSIMSGNVAGGINNIISGAKDVTDSVLNNKLINAKAYTSNKSIDANSIGYLNAYYGLLLFVVDSINDTEVNNINNKYGYIYNAPTLTGNNYINFYPNGAVFEICDLDNTHIPDKIRYIQMSNVYIKGQFSQEIRNKLVNIINNGFRLVTYKHAINYESYL